MENTNGYAARSAMLAALGTGSNAIPLLIAGLTNQLADVRNAAADCLLNEFGSRYPELRRPALPLLIKLLNDPDEDVRTTATNELKEADPIAAAKAGIK